MQLQFIIIFLFIAFIGQAQAENSADVATKLEQIDQEIAKIEGFLNRGEAPEIYQNHLLQLKTEKSKYQKLSKKLKNNEKVKTVVVDPSAKKTLPSVVVEKVAELEKFKQDSVPVQERHNLILKEISSSYEVIDRLKALPPSSQSTEIKKFIVDEKKKIHELEKLRREYEVKVNEIEENDVIEMKKSGVRVGAMFDVYYQWDMNTPSKRRNDKDIPFKNYNTKHNDLTIALAEINFMKTYKNMDFYMDLDFGEMPEQNRAISEDAITTHLGQAFLRYRVPELENTIFTAGKFYTHFGLEVAKNIENRNYSRPFYYTLVCPFWHEGFSLTKSGMGNWGTGLYLYDRTDRREDNNSGKTYGFQLNYTTEKLSAVYNLISGPEETSAGSTTSSKEGNTKTMNEIIVTYNATEKTTFVMDALTGYNQGYDATTGKDYRWAGVVGYVDQKLNDKNKLCLRAEYFSDQTSKLASTNLFTTVDKAVKPTSVQGYTLTNRYNLNKFSEVRLEYRYDTATEKIFPKNKTDYSTVQSTVTLAWLYSI